MTFGTTLGEHFTMTVSTNMFYIAIVSVSLKGYHKFNQYKNLNKGLIIL